MRILFTCYPGVGHLHPMLPLARAARRAGHDVAFATGPDLAPRAEQRLRQVAPRMFVDIAARSRVAELRERAGRWGAELIVHDQSEFAAPIVAALLGTPTVVHSWGPMMPAALLALVEPAVEALAVEHGARINLAGVVEGSVYVDICPPGLQLPGGPAWRRVQPLRHEDPLPGPDEDAIGRLPRAETVYVTLGTVVNKLPGIFETVLAALDGTDVNVIVTVGPDVDPERLGPQPEHVLVERYIPQGLVLPRCSALVAHAGAGTMLGALAHGVPQVLLPHGAEQHLNAGSRRSFVSLPASTANEAVNAGTLPRFLRLPAFTR